MSAILDLMPVTPAQARAARALLNISQRDLAAASGVSRRTILSFENEQRNLIPATRDALQRALEAAGVRFLGEVGVALADASPDDDS